jgi:hypothetical protein
VIGILACGVITLALLVFMCVRNARKLNRTAKQNLMTSFVGNVRLIPKTVVFRSDHRRALRAEDNDVKKQGTTQSSIVAELHQSRRHAVPS